MHESLLIGRREGAIAVKATIPAAKVNIAMLSRDKQAEWKAQVPGRAETDTSGSTRLECGQKRLGNHIGSQVGLRCQTTKTLKLKV